MLCLRSPSMYLSVGDELVQVVEPLVVAHVGHHVAGFGDDHVGALVLEAAHARSASSGVEVGSNGSTSTIQPKRLASFS